MPASFGPAALALTCEQRAADAFLGQPVTTLTSFAFVVAGLAIVAGLPRARARVPPAALPGRALPRRAWYGLLVAAVGVGSVIQHGPHPPWQAYAHDLSLGAVLAYVALDAARDLSATAEGGAGASAPALQHAPAPAKAAGWWLPAWSWLVPTAALVPFVATGPGASTAAQVTLAVLAFGLGLLRAAARPALRRTLLSALAVLAAGAAIGTLGDRTALCQPESLLQGHGFWHLLAALALLLLTPAIARHGPADRVDHGRLARLAGRHADKTP